MTHVSVSRYLYAGLFTPAAAFPFTNWFITNDTKSMFVGLGCILPGVVLACTMAYAHFKDEKWANNEMLDTILALFSVMLLFGVCLNMVLFFINRPSSLKNNTTFGYIVLNFMYVVIVTTVIRVITTYKNKSQK